MATFLSNPDDAPPQGSSLDGGVLLTLPEVAMLANAPRRADGATPRAAPDPARQWWNYPAKKAAGERIAQEVSARFVGHHNDLGDAQRHAEWSQRMASEIGPVFSGLAGAYHEWTNVQDDLAAQTRWRLMKPEQRAQHAPPPSLAQTLSESGMDLRNNAEGVAAAVGRRPIDPGHLQTRPVIPGYR